MGPTSSPNPTSDSSPNPTSNPTPEPPRYSRERAVTMWWVLFNKPSECLHGADGALCGMKDVMTNANNVDNPAWISIVHAAGGKSEYWGDLTLTSTIYKTKQSLNLADPEGGYVWGGPPAFNNPETRGYFPATNEETEVHLVFRDHGPPSFSYLEQITTFTDPDVLREAVLIYVLILVTLRSQIQ